MCDSYDKQTCRCPECRPANELLEQMAGGYARVTSSFGDERVFWVLCSYPDKKRPPRRTLKPDSLLAQEIKRRAINEAVRERRAVAYVRAMEGLVERQLSGLSAGDEIEVVSPVDPSKKMRVKIKSKGRPPGPWRSGPSTFIWRGKVRSF